MSHDSYTHDRSWETKYHPKVKAILGEHLVVDASDTEDIHRNTDLTTMELRNYRIGVRIRRNRYLAGKDRGTGVAYTEQFTIRATRPNGSDTELAKIMFGWGDYFFYGFENQAGDDLACWMIGDLYLFRRWFYTVGQAAVTAGQKENHDQSSSFYTFNIADMPTGFVVARQSPSVEDRLTAGTTTATNMPLFDAVRGS